MSATRAVALVYTEIVRSHFGVISPDARLQRPEYLGGGSTPINVNPIAQTTLSLLRVRLPLKVTWPLWLLLRLLVTVL